MNSFYSSRRRMKLTNRTDFDDAFLKAMIRWLCGLFSISTNSLYYLEFGNTSAAWGGRAWGRSRRILVRIGNNSCFPTRVGTRGMKISQYIENRTEALVTITAHELFHVVQSKDNVRASREQGADWAMLEALNRFRDNREALLKEWNLKVEKKKARRVQKVKKSKVELREANARKKVKEWERKLKLAETKLKIWEKKVRYYEKRSEQKGQK